MRSSSGDYQIGLDHLRAVAVLMVFCWHFIHSGNIVPLDGSDPAMPLLAPFANGYMGVSLFMVLSGYLFARIADGKRLSYGAFIKNRALRLLPLLALAMVLSYVHSKLTGHDLKMGTRLMLGWLAPTLPQGGWSVTVECHFYLLLPVFLWLQARTRWALVGVILAAIALRVAMHASHVNMEYFAYHTLVGRVDQFMLGMVAYGLRARIKGRHALWLLGAAVFAAYAAWIDHLGSNFNPKRDLSQLWVFTTTVEGVFFAWTVAWYEQSFRFSSTGVSGLLGRIGQSSYSMYLLHTFVVFFMARWIDQHVLSLHNVHVALAAAVVSFLAFLPVAVLSHRWIEKPFLRRRVVYAHPVPVVAVADPAATAPGPDLARAA